MVAEWIKEVSGWEEEYMILRECDPGPYLTDTECEILQKDGLASNEGMIYGRTVSYTHLTLPTICSV